MLSTYWFKFYEIINCSTSHIHIIVLRWFLTSLSKAFSNEESNHRTVIGIGTTCKKIPCYMRGSGRWWFIVKKSLKYFEVMLNIVLILAYVKKRRILIGLCK